ncbi:NUDIX hydrolase [Gracilibacillus caseinilyticus]|uniref:NUDIX hydrolase n=1 Tax=Gracilibacillus caseinilyticus TaxID=2932256 RepID=A0ABY4EX91_9BACI|nr:NUDIX hydrolase [Gracilibacillus caseinilyticus]UOQ48575.1 NUDIX hydrolase [Gracilibacillus caseinilyticus]
MQKRIIRPIVICIFSNQNSILVAEGFDSVKGDYFYRPIGGGMEFGESSADALVREITEEINQEITNLSYLGAVENFFTFNGDTGHEIVMVYDAQFVDQTIYHIESFEGIEDDGEKINLFWKPLSDFVEGRLRLVPEALMTLIQQK